ncbi:MAG: sigma-70 family RNA polymerase sigma factor [Verrucomicrobia bacterium]|nr:sigma-70 family RNA polymerase sigma factor [Verrucomicrobiota bacterium]
MDDWQLLQDYVARESDAAFRTLVNRYVNLVYSVALRQVRDAHLAEEVAQAVFILLARKASSFRPSVVLSGWLFRTTRFVASRAVRAEQRRQRREQEAFAMQQFTAPDDTWKRIAPALDEGLEHLGEADRNALLLRFFNDKSHRETAAALGVSEDAAKKRVTRALDKLRNFFAGRGVSLSTAMLASTIAGNGAKAATPEITASIVAKVIASGSAGAGILTPLVSQTLNAWRWAKLKLAGVGVAVGTAAIVLVILVSPKGPIQPGSSDLAVQAADSRLTTAATESSEPRTVVSSQQPVSNGAMRFRVVAADNDEPAAYARLALQTATNEKWEERFDLATDETGECELPLAEGLRSMAVGVIASGWEGRFMTWATDRDGEFPAEYTLRVQRVTNSLGGWVRDETGAPVAGVEIWMQWSDYTDYPSRETPRERMGFCNDAPVAMSDRNGRWSCAVIPPQNKRYYGLSARQPGFAETAIESGNPERMNTDLQRDSFRQLWAGKLVTTLQRGITLTGRVMDQYGQPIARARVVQKPQSADAKSLETDMFGQFVITNLPVGTFPITVQASGFAPEYRDVNVRQNMESLEVQLKPGLQLRLRVVDEQGAPVSEATVVLEQWGENRHVIDWREKSGSDGRLEWDSAPPSRLQLCAYKDGWCITRDVWITPDGEEHTIELRRALELSGYVTDAETGAPIAEFKAFPGYSEDSGEHVWELLATRQGKRGMFTVTFSETRQPWRVRVEAEGYEPAISKPLPADFAGTLALSLKRVNPALAFRGFVQLPDGSPAANAQVALLTLESGALLGRARFLDRGQSVLTNTDARGFFAFAPDPRAHSVAAVAAEGFGRTRVRRPGEPFTLRLQPWARIEGVLAASLSTKSSDQIVLMDDTAMNYRGSVALEYETFSTPLDAERRFTLEPVPEGEFNLYLNRGLGIPFTARTPVQTQPEETVSVQMGGAGVTVVGKLALKSGRALEWGGQTQFAMLASAVTPLPQPPGLTGEALELWKVDYWRSEAARETLRKNHSFTVTVANDGSFRAEGVLAGEYKLSIFAADTSLNTSVTIPEASGTEAKEVNLGMLYLTEPASRPVGSVR